MKQVKEALDNIREGIQTLIITFNPVYTDTIIDRLWDNTKPDKENVKRINKLNFYAVTILTEDFDYNYSIVKDTCYQKLRKGTEYIIVNGVDDPLGEFKYYAKDISDEFNVIVSYSTKESKKVIKINPKLIV